MVLGVIMLSAIGYVALSTGERPFHAVNEHVSPVLGWGWAIATAMANVVWCLPQFSLGVAAVRENLFSRTLSDAAMATPGGIFWSKALVAGAILAAAIAVSYTHLTLPTNREV